MLKVDLNESLFYSKEIITRGDYYSGKTFREYSKGYLATNEDIKSYLTLEKFRGKKALTVLASGDQAFNLALCGAETIDAFDINKLEYYVFWLKKAMTQVLNYSDYVKAIGSFLSVLGIPYLLEVLEKAKGYMPEDVYEYYRKILEFALKKGRLTNLYGFVMEGFWKNRNLYLQDEASYDNLRKILRDVTINLHFGDAREIPYRLDDSYDIVLLSNIADYLGNARSFLTLEKFQEFISAYYSLLNPKGVIINYLFDLGIHYDGEEIICSSFITKDDLGSENLQHIPQTVDGYYRVRKP